MKLEDLTAYLAFAAGVVLVALALVIAYRIMKGTIDISGLFNGGTVGEASTSRFQLVVFTFMVAFAYLIFLLKWMTAQADKGMPEIPWSLLALLGVSAATYAAGKKLDETAKPPTADPNKPDPTGAKG
jgi:hypothetical protein